MIDVARPVRGPLLALTVLLAVAGGAALPARAQEAAPTPTQSATTPAAAKPVALTADRASEWWLPALGAAQAWRDAPGQGKGVTVAVLSTGVDDGHPDLAGSVTEGPDYSGTGRKTGGPFWGAEGTAVASLIAGHGHGQGGTDGITGLAPGARILSVQVTVEYNDAQMTSNAAVISRLPGAIAAGIKYAVAHGATVIALPLDPATLRPATGQAVTGGSAAEQAAVSDALAHDVVLVAPAGDNAASTGTVNFPAGYPGVIAVGATDRAGQLASFSSTRSYVALTAPGAGVTATGAMAGLANPAGGITVAAPGGGYDSLATTDMAAALVTGAAALIRGQYPSLTAAEVTQALQRGAVAATPGSSSGSATPAPGSAPATPGAGHGALNAAAALTAAAAIAAANPKPATRPAASASAPGAGSATAARSRSIGSLARSLLVYLVIGAAGLIAIAVGAMVATGSRRKRALAARSGMRTRNAPAAANIRGRHGAALPPQAQPGAAVRTHIAPASRVRAAKASPVSAAATPATASRTARPRPAAPSPAPSAPAKVPAVGRAGYLDRPPWELPWGDFTPAAPPVDPPTRPVTSSGPIYIWNPAATGPQPAAPDDWKGAE